MKHFQVHTSFADFQNTHGMLLIQAKFSKGLSHQLEILQKAVRRMVWKFSVTSSIDSSFTVIKSRPTPWAIGRRNRNSLFLLAGSFSPRFSIFTMPKKTSGDKMENASVCNIIQAFIRVRPFLSYLAFQLYHFQPNSNRCDCPFNMSTL